MSRDIIETVNIMPEKRWKDIENFYGEIDSKLKHEDLCGSYEKAYLCYCDSYYSNIFAEVGWVRNIFQCSDKLQYSKQQCWLIIKLSCFLLFSIPRHFQIRMSTLFMHCTMQKNFDSTTSTMSTQSKKFIWNSHRFYDDSLMRQ